jgi:hypothetical protein
MGALSQRIIAKVRGRGWEQLRGQFTQMAHLFLSVSPNADSDLHNSYVKFTVNSNPQSPAYAAIWLKTSKHLDVGLALPEEYEAEGLGPAPPGMTYKGLTKYFVVERGGVVPKGLTEWAGLAHQNVLAVEPLTAFMDHVAVSQLAAREGVSLRRAG